jgi:predicted RNase H-like nuclease (RuvC/YqgF family)
LCDSDEYDDDDCVAVNNSSLYLKNEFIIDKNNRLESLFDERNKVLLTKERIIEDLNVKILELDSKLKEGEMKINELKSKINYESYLCEIGLLKVKV